MWKLLSKTKTKLKKNNFGDPPPHAHIIKAIQEVQPYAMLTFLFSGAFTRIADKIVAYD